MPILVVDDNEANRDVLARRLGRDDRFAVTCVESGERALEIARPDQFHLVLLDIMMPGLSGLEVLQRIRLTHTAAELPVIMVTARDEPFDIVQSLTLGANDHVGKPIDFPVLLARIKTQLQLRNLSRLKDEFLRVASHDLKNPLAFVSLCAQDMADSFPPGTPLSAKAHARLLRIAERCGDMQRIIADFLDFEALHDGGLALRRQRADLNALVRNAVANQDAIAEAKGIKLVLDLAAVPLELELDEVRMGQVLDNLIGNAVKYGPAGTSVVARARHDGDVATVEVVDDGHGVRPEEIPLLFQKYKRLSTLPTAGETSSGVGLFICKQIVELHGGEIGARNNTEASGCTFWFRLAAPPCGGASTGSKARS